MPTSTVLVTGGAGFIGSHTVVELITNGFDVVVVDNMVNAAQESLRRVEKIVGKSIVCYTVNLLDKAALDEVFGKHDIAHVIHFAALKAVGESVEKPLLYYRNNIDSTLTLLEVMQERGVHSFVFSSSATVYGTPQELPLAETHPVGQGVTNPYGMSKFFIEQMILDLVKAESKWKVTILRYFNPIGAHKSGTIGENPNGVPNNLMPYLAQVAVGRREFLSVFGDDYDTPDGTGVRDYIHVVDLAQGHVCALTKQEEFAPGCRIYNLGTGRGYSVLELVRALEKASGKTIPYKVAPRRAGDLASLYADASKAHEDLGWKATRSLDEMCEDVWRWQSNNPKGFDA